jgi:general secretion pathway protein C
MLSNLTRLLIHFVGGGLACAQLAYWTIRLMTPPPAPAPAPVRVAVPHEPDAMLLARAFGQVERVAPAALANIQVTGVFAAGRDSAAVFVVGDRPARAVRLGQEVAPGSTLVEVDPLSVTLDSGGVRRQLRVPNVPVASSGGPLAEAGAGFERRGNVLTAPSLETVAAPPPRSTVARPGAGIMPPRPEPRPESVPPPQAGMPAPLTRHELVGRPNPPQ